MPENKAGIWTFYILAAVLAAILLAGYFLRHTFSALLTSLALAYLLNPVLKYLEKRGFDRFTALALMYGMAILAGMFTSFLLLPYLLHQAEALINSLPRDIQNIRTAMDNWKLRITPYYAGDEGTWLIEQAEESLATLTRELSGTGYNRMIPLSERSHLTELGRKINRSLERFIIGMLLDCLAVGLLTVAALYLLDIEFPVLNGLFAGFASIVPFLGVLVAIIPAAFIGYAKSGDLSIIPKVSVAYFFIYVIIEGNLIKPLVMRRALRLNPLAVIFAVMAMGELLGFWGIILAIPLAAVVKICVDELRELFIGQGREHGNRKI